jgi:hypothetical protein
MRRSKSPVIVFQVEQTGAGDFVALTSDGTIFVQAKSFGVLHQNVIQAVSARMSNYPGKIMVRLQLARVSTSLLVGYTAALYAWLIEISLVLLHIFSKGEARHNRTCSVAGDNISFDSNRLAA